jgi:hypothetical protein
MTSKLNGSSALAAAVLQRGVTITPTTPVVTNAFPQLSFLLDGQGIASAEVLLAADPGLFATARAGERNARNFHSSRFDLGPIRVEGGGVYTVPPAVLQRFAGAGAGRLYYMAVGFSDREIHDPVTTTPAIADIASAPSVELEAGFTGTTLSHVLGDLDGRDRLLALGMTADGAAAPRRTPVAARDVVERPALARAPGPIASPAPSTHRDADAAPPVAAPPAAPAIPIVAAPSIPSAPPLPTAAPAIPAPPAPTADGGAGGMFGRFIDEDFMSSAAPIAGAAAPVAGGAARGAVRGVLDGGGLSPLLDTFAPAGAPARGVLDAVIGGARGLLGLGLSDDGAEVAPTRPLDNEARRRIVEAVCGLETGRPRYDAVNPDGEYRGRFGRENPYFERAHAGLGFGIVLFGQDTGDLGRLLQAMKTRDADAFARIFGPTADSLLETATAAGPGGLESADGRSARVRPVDGQDLWVEPWLARFRAAGGHPPFQAAQNQLASDLYLEPMVQTARRLGVATERGLALMMDRAIAMGTEAAASFFVNGAGVGGSDAARSAALRALVGASGLEEYQRGKGLQPTGTWSVETKARMVADLRAMGQDSPVAVPGYDEMLDRFVAAAGGSPWAGRFERLRRHADLTDIPFAEA